MRLFWAPYLCLYGSWSASRSTHHHAVDRGTAPGGPLRNRLRYSQAEHSCVRTFRSSKDCTTCTMTFEVSLRSSKVLQFGSGEGLRALTSLYQGCVRASLGYIHSYLPLSDPTTASLPTVYVGEGS